MKIKGSKKMSTEDILMLIIVVLIIIIVIYWLYKSMIKSVKHHEGFIAINTDCYDNLKSCYFDKLNKTSDDDFKDNKKRREIFTKYATECTEQLKDSTCKDIILQDQISNPCDAMCLAFRNKCYTESRMGTQSQCSNDINRCKEGCVGKLRNYYNM